MEKPLEPTDVFCLSDGSNNVLQGRYPDRVYSQINRLELHYFQADTPKAQAFIYAGGGYVELVHDKEGLEIAEWLSSIGIDAYVVTHRLPGTNNELGGVYPADIALQDGLTCLEFLKQRSSLPLLHIGLSSGGHLAGVMACQTDIIQAAGALIAYAPINANHKDYKYPQGKPDYPPVEKQDFYNSWSIGIETEPHGIPAIPVFLAYPLHDQAVPIDHALNMIKTAHRTGGDVEAHIYPQAPHGFALRDKNGSHDQWSQTAERWIDRVLI